MLRNYDKNRSEAWKLNMLGNTKHLKNPNAPEIVNKNIWNPLTFR